MATGIDGEAADIGRRARRSRLRVALVGYGAINKRVAHLLIERNSEVDVVAVATRSGRDASLPKGAVPLASVKELAAVEADIVIEAAGREAVVDWGEAALDCGASFAVSSASAFVDDALFWRLRDLASSRGAQILISPGAVGGIDALAAAGRLGLNRLTHTIAKPPSAWKGTPAFLEEVPDGGTVFFSGSAREVARRFPANANVVVVTALASGLGLDHARVELASDPALTRNRHTIDAEGIFGRLWVNIENRPLAANPRSSELAAYALVRLVENAIADVSI